MVCVAENFLVNDQIIPTNKFDITVLEKGISIYEVVKIIDGIPLFIEDHLRRLNRSAKIKNLSIWIDDEFIRKQVLKLIEINKNKSGRMKFALRFHETGNNLICFFLENIQPKNEVYNKGIKIIPKTHERKNPNAKVINYSLRKTIKKLIKKENAFESLLVSKSGKLTECSKSNIFFIKDNAVYTPFKKDVLPGVTRLYIFQLCKENNINIFEEDILYEEISNYDAAFISGTSIGILGIKKINGHTFTLNNSVLRIISKLYTEVANKYIIDFKINPETI